MAYIYNRIPTIIRIKIYIIFLEDLFYRTSRVRCRFDAVEFSIKLKEDTSYRSVVVIIIVVTSISISTKIGIIQYNDIITNGKSKVLTPSW